MTKQGAPPPLMSMADELIVWTSYLLRQAALRAQSEVGRALATARLRPPHHSVMEMIASQGRSQTDLSARLQTDQTTMVAIVDDLEKLRLAKRRTSPLDRRAHEVTLTKRGQDVLKHSRSLLESADERLVSSLDPSEREELKRLLLKLIRAHDVSREEEERTQ